MTEIESIKQHISKLNVDQNRIAKEIEGLTKRMRSICSHENIVDKVDRYEHFNLHYDECTLCGETFNEEEHTYDW